MKTDHEKAATMLRIRREDALQKAILEGLSDEIRERVLLYSSHKLGVMRICMPGHRPIDGHMVSLGPFAVGCCFHIVKRNWKRLWLKERIASMHGSLGEALKAAEK